MRKLRKISDGIDGLFTGTNLEMKLRLADASGIADGSDFFAFHDFLAFFHQQFLIMGISGYPAAAVLHQNQVTKAFELVTGINDNAFIRGFDRSSTGSADVDTVIVAAFADGTEFGDDFAFNRPGKFCLAGFDYGCPRRRFGRFPDRRNFFGGRFLLNRFFRRG